MILTFKLILAHLLGDFLLQPSSWVEKKHVCFWKTWTFYAHIVIHAALVLLLTQNLKYAAVIFVTHAVIDGIKAHLHKPEKARLYFIIDQFFHAVVIWFLVVGTYPVNMDVIVQTFEANIITITAAVFLTIPSSILIQMIVEKWKVDLDLVNDGSLASAGEYIGVVERLLVFFFALNGHYEAIGFLIAAKSVFRFGELSNSKNRKMTEYVVVGTLTSISIAILVSEIVLVLKGVY